MVIVNDLYLKSDGTWVWKIWARTTTAWRKKAISTFPLVEKEKCCNQSLPTTKRRFIAPGPGLLGGTRERGLNK